MANNTEIKTVTQYLDQDYREYAVYVVEERAIPSVIDGFKPTQRKVIFVADRVWRNGSEKPLKIFQLAGKVAAEAHYHHGDCLDPETVIHLSTGETITIFDWYSKYPDKQLKLLVFNEKTKKFIEGTGHSPRIGSTIDSEIEIEMENGETIKCTENHPFLTNRGWVCAGELNKTDEIINFKKD